MAITVYEATKFKTFKNFKLISGFSGLDNLVEKVGILDWEFFSKMEGQFIQGEFVLTSLLFAKDNPSFIFEAVKALIKDGASGLAIKNIYYENLPLEVVDYANEKAFPIFIFDNSVYFEDIITEVADKIRFADNYEILETKIDILIKKNLNKATVKEIAYEINSSFKEHFFVLYCKKKNYFEDNNMIALLERLTRTKNIDLYSSVLKYRNGILIIFTDEMIAEKDIARNANNLIERIGINLSEYCIGVSNAHSTLGELDNGINESIFAQKTGELSNNSFHHFSDIGIYGILMPHADEIWMHNFYDRIILPIKNYDQKHNTELFDTAIRYIEKDGKIIETANSFFVHKNTIRYRIGKIKELLNMEDCEGSFYEQLSAAIKLYKIYNN
jgi:hypothetical protein